MGRVSVTSLYSIEKKHLSKIDSFVYPFDVQNRGLTLLAEGLFSQIFLASESGWGSQ